MFSGIVWWLEHIWRWTRVTVSVDWLNWTYNWTGLNSYTLSFELHSLLQGSFGKRGGRVTAEVGHAFILAPSCGVASIVKKQKNKTKLYQLKSEIMHWLLYFLLVDINYIYVCINIVLVFFFAIITIIIFIFLFYFCFLMTFSLVICYVSACFYAQF